MSAAAIRLPVHSDSTAWATDWGSSRLPNACGRATPMGAARPQIRPCARTRLQSRYTTAATTKITSGMVTRKMPIMSMMKPARIIVVMGV